MTGGSGGILAKRESSTDRMIDNTEVVEGHLGTIVEITAVQPPISRSSWVMKAMTIVFIVLGIVIMVMPRFSEAFRNPNSTRKRPTRKRSKN
eukprot:TRINITY_DN6485_c1_g2_i1.p1 TRINITY_DN6485_c1_g2~~TRINITY_DN6485_c1_g2_i1.p1  ORF type:complete len:108 (+),score=15.13 TRINITY_DN6485_c1_g2_i1:50-325(+)